MRSISPRDPDRVAMVSDYSLDVLGGAETAFCEQVRAMAGRASVLTVSSPSRQLVELGTLPTVETIAVPARVHLPVYGFPIVRRTPVLERSELHERKSGAGIVAKLYELAGSGPGGVCLRPASPPALLVKTAPIRVSLYLGAKPCRARTAIDGPSMWKKRRAAARVSEKPKPSAPRAA